MTNYFFKSDFKIKDSSADYQTNPFVLAFWTYKFNRKFVASYDGETYKNCKLNDDGSLTVDFYGHNLGVGVLKCQKTFFLPDNDSPSGVRQESSVGYYDVRLTIKHADIYTDMNANVCFCGDTPNILAGKVVSDDEGNATMINTIDGVTVENDGSVTINL